MANEKQAQAEQLFHDPTILGREGSSKKAPGIDVDATPPERIDASGNEFVQTASRPVESGYELQPEATHSNADAANNLHDPTEDHASSPFAFDDFLESSGGSPNWTDVVEVDVANGWASDGHASWTDKVESDHPAPDTSHGIADHHGHAERSETTQGQNAVNADDKVDW